MILRIQYKVGIIIFFSVRNVSLENIYILWPHILKVSFKSPKCLSQYKKLLITKFLFIILGMPIYIPEHFKTTNYIAHLVVNIIVLEKRIHLLKLACESLSPL